MIATLVRGERIESESHALLAARAAIAKHAEDVVVMDLRRLSSISDFFVIATANSQRQVAAMTEEIDTRLRRAGHRVRHIEGLSPASAYRPGSGTGRSAASAARGDSGVTWVLMDCGSLVVHLFTPPAREFYQLERLWGDAPRIPLEQHAF